MTGRPAPGTPLTFRWRKWDGSPHWTHECVFLGSDEWGDWVGQESGWRSERPGRAIIVDSPAVMLLPPSGDYTLTVNGPPHRVRIYIDIAWDVRWEGGEATGIDMDLDVVRALDARGVFIDDRDEWDEHRVRDGYPLDLVARLEQLAVDLEQKVTAFVPPFDDATADRWLAVLAVGVGDAESPRIDG